MYPLPDQTRLLSEVAKTFTLSGQLDQDLLKFFSKVWGWLLPSAGIGWVLPIWIFKNSIPASQPWCRQRRPASGLNIHQHSKSAPTPLQPDQLFKSAATRSDMNDEYSTAQSRFEHTLGNPTNHTYDQFDFTLWNFSFTLLDIAFFKSDFDLPVGPS